MDCQTTLRGWWSEYWTPPALQNPWQWAEGHLTLSARSTPYPGRFSTARTPFVREPLAAFQDAAVRRITLCFSAQSGKTTVLSVALAYTIAEAPGPCLYALPSESAALSFSRNRLQPLIQDCEVLSRHMTAKKYDFSRLEMLLDRMTIYMAGAQTPAQLAMRPIRYLFADEIDKWPGSTSKEADSLSLAVERVKSFRDHKVVLASTPTVESGPIWSNFLAGSRELYHITCTGCGTCFAPEWPDIRWPEDATLEQVREDTWLECPECQERYTERQKVSLLQGGSWIATNPDAPEDHRSFRVSEIMSPVTRWSDLACKFLTARAAAKIGDLGPLHSFVNSSLAQCWSEPEHQSHAKPEHVQRLCDTRQQGELPGLPIAALTAGVDTQDNGFWCVIRAWGENMTSWLVRECFAPDAATMVEILLNSRFRHPDGTDHAVRMVFWDSAGHRTAEVYDICRKSPIFKAMHGVQKLWGSTWASKQIDKYTSRDGKSHPIPGGLQLIRIDTTHYKDLLSAKLNLDPGQPGSMSIPQDISGDYLSHMTSEYRDAKGVWQRPKHKRGDLWDCEVYALAAADCLGVRNWRSAGEPKPRPRPKPQQHGPNPFLTGTHNRWW